MCNAYDVMMQMYEEYQCESTAPSLIFLTFGPCNFFQPSQLRFFMFLNSYIWQKCCKFAFNNSCRL